MEKDFMMRLDKFLAQMSVGSRNDVKGLIRKGQILVNGQVVKKPEWKVDPEGDLILCGGKKIEYAAYEYYMLHKPAGVVSATEDKKDTTVIDLIDSKRRKDLFPVGRLDKDTEGLLLITNDGKLAHELLSPKKHVDKIYFARIQGKVTSEDVEDFKKGVNIGSQEKAEITMPASLSIISSGEQSEIRLKIQEGKFHQIKRMFQAVGKEVIYLRRETMGNLKLDPKLSLGQYRPLTEEEIKGLKNES